MYQKTRVQNRDFNWGSMIPSFRICFYEWESIAFHWLINKWYNSEVHFGIKS
jgi:hypothetical protein